MSRFHPTRPVAAAAVRRLADTAAAEFGFTPEQLRGPGRHAALARARFAFCWAASVGLGASLGTIGRELGRHHTTILNAVTRAGDIRDRDTAFRTAADRLRAAAGEARNA